MREAITSWPRVAGSGQFFSVWSWILTLPLAVTVMGGYDLASTAQARALGIAFAFGVHVALGLVGVAAAALERRTDSTRARITIIVVAVALMTVSRPLLLAWSARMTGSELFDGPIIARIATNLIVGSTVLFIIAAVVVAVRSRQDAAARLRDVLAALDRQREHDSRDVEALTEQVLTTTRASILAALPASVTNDFDAQKAGDALRRFSEEVVRPLSHRLFDSAGESHSTPAIARTHPRERAQFADLLRPAPALLAAVPYVALWAPYALVRLPVPQSLLLACVAVALAVSGNLLVRRGFGAPSARARTLLLVVAYSLVGAITSATVAAVGSFTYPVQFVVANAILYPAFAVFLAAGRAGFDLLARNEVELARAIEESTALAAGAHNRVVIARRRVARTLHADIQAECIAAATAMAQTDSFAESDWDRVIDRINSLLSVSARQDASSQASFETMLAAWRHSLEITVESEPSVWGLLDEDPARLELVLDAVSEALTNVIRHADAPRAEVVLARSGTAAISLQISSPGTLTSGSADGYGIAELSTRAPLVDLVQNGPSVRLQLEIA